MYTTNVYTLQSIRTGKYISSLFSDGHNETFQGWSFDDCYTWNSLEVVTKIKEEINSCLIIKIN